MIDDMAIACGGCFCRPNDLMRGTSVALGFGMIWKFHFFLYTYLNFFYTSFILLRCLRRARGRLLSVKITEIMVQVSTAITTLHQPDSLIMLMISLKDFDLL